MLYSDILFQSGLVAEETVLSPLSPSLPPTHPSSPLSPHRPRMSKCLNFYILNSQFIHNDSQVYSVNAQILLSTDRCPRVLNLWFPVQLMSSMSAVAAAMSPGSLNIIHHNDTFC